MVVQAEQQSSSSSSSSFVPRPFPPPSLANVPIEYIVDQLHRLAVHYWDKPETSDCTLVVPYPVKQNAPFSRRSTPCNSSASSLSGKSSSGRSSASSKAMIMGRGPPEPAVQRYTRMTSKLHIDFLSAQCTILRAIFSGTPLRDATRSDSSSSSSSHAIPTHKLPRILPTSTPNNTVVFLPLPDPPSFPFLVHYMYFGETRYLEEGLSRKQITWEGVVRNVEYLGMPPDIKRFLGRWYGHWMAPSRPGPDGRREVPVVHAEDSDEEDAEHHDPLDEADCEMSDSPFEDSDSDVSDGEDAMSDCEDEDAACGLPPTPGRPRPLLRRPVPLKHCAGLPSPPSSDEL